MVQFSDWQSQLQFVDDLMRASSRVADPQELVRLYGDGVSRIYPVDLWLAISRRDINPPFYRITRSWRWEGEDINPWTEKHRLPMLSGGLLGELLYGDRPRVIEDVHVAPDDPAREHLEGVRAIFAMPQYDNGVAVNMALMMFKDPASLNHVGLANMLWQANLFGRATLNMVLRQQLRNAYDDLDREMEVVGHMQRSLLPARLPDIPGIELAAHYETSQRAGGNYYDVFPLPDGEWGLFIADVSGHGTPAAVTMAITHALAHAHPGPPTPPAAMLRHLNERLASQYTNESGQFVTAFYCVFDPRSRRLTYSSAGHNPPRLARKGGVISLGAAGGFPLGITSDADFGEATITLEPHDLLLLYTDGVTEAGNGQGAMYDVPRLDELLLSACHTAAGAIDAINLDLRRFSERAPLTDDRTLLAMRVVG